MAFKNPFARKPEPAPVVPAPDPRAMSDAIVWSYVKRAFALGVVGSMALHSDVAVLVLLWGLMIYGLAQHHGIEMSRKYAMKIATALMAAATTFMVGFAAAGFYFKLTVVGIPAALTLNASVDALFTCAVGMIVSNIFRSGGDATSLPQPINPGGDRRQPEWLDIILKHFREFLTDLSVEAIRIFIQNGGSIQAFMKMREGKDFVATRP